MQAITKETLQSLTDEQIVALEREIERKRVREDLKYLCNRYLGYHDINEELHGEVIKQLKKAKKKKKLAFILPRFHLKSSLITIAWVIQQILINPNITICILNAVNDKALDFIREIKSHLTNPELVALFPEILFEKPPNDIIWKEDRFCVKQTKVVSGVTVLGTSIEGEITGKHFDIMIFDDIQGKKNSATAFLINKVILSYKACIPILTPNGTQIVVGTRWKKEDFYYWLEGTKQFEFMVRCATVNENGEPCRLEYDHARPIFPQKFTLEKLHEYKAMMGPFEYSCQMENNPLAEEDITFREEWIKYYDEEPKYKRIYVLVDPAISLSAQRDETVISVIGQPVQDDLPLHCRRSRGIGFDKSKGDVQVVIDAIFEEYLVARKFASDIVLGIEVASFQHVLKQWVEKEKLKRKLFFDITNLEPKNRKKPDRIKALQPLFESGGILFHRTECEKLIAQLLAWPSSIHDDHVDVLAYLLDVLIEAADISISVYSDKINYSDPNSYAAALAELEGVYSDRTWRDY